MTCRSQKGIGELHIWHSWNMKQGEVNKMNIPKYGIFWVYPMLSPNILLIIRSIWCSLSITPICLLKNRLTTVLVNECVGRGREEKGGNVHVFFLDGCIIASNSWVLCMCDSCHLANTVRTELGTLSAECKSLWRGKISGREWIHTYILWA